MHGQCVRRARRTHCPCIGRRACAIRGGRGEMLQRAAAACIASPANLMTSPLCDAMPLMSSSRYELMYLRVRGSSARTRSARDRRFRPDPAARHQFFELAGPTGLPARQL
eukprot:6364964-Prymnesium_polylepis.1